MADEPTPVEEAREEVEEVTPPPEPPKKDDDMPAWAKTLSDKVDTLTEQVAAMTPVPPPADEVIENDEAPTPLPWTHRGIGGHKHED